MERGKVKENQLTKKKNQVRQVAKKGMNRTKIIKISPEDKGDEAITGFLEKF